MYTLVFGQVRLGAGQWQKIPELVVNDWTPSPVTGQTQIKGPVELAKEIHDHVQLALGHSHPIIVDIAQLCGWVDYGLVSVFRMIPIGPTVGLYPPEDGPPPAGIYTGAGAGRAHLVPVPRDPGGGEPA